MRRVLGLVVALTAVSVLAGCTVDPGSSDAGRTVDLGGGVHLVVPDGAMPADADVRGGPVATPADLPAAPGLGASGAVQVTTSVQPSAPVTVEIPVAEAALADVPATADDRILVLHQHEGGPWEPLLGQLDRARHVVSVRTPSLSVFAVSLPSLKVLGAKVADLLNGYFGGVGFRHDPPTCSGTEATRTAGYRVRSSSSDVLQWCIGTGPNGAPVLKVRVNRRYPLLATMGAGLSVVDSTDGELPVGMAQWATANLGRPDQATLAPGGTTTLAVDLPPGRGASVRTEFDGFAQALVALQVALDLVAVIYAKGAPAADVHTMIALTKADCRTKVVGYAADPADAGRLGSMLGACVDPQDVGGPFGKLLQTAAIATVAALGGVIAYLISSGSYAVDTVRGRSTYRIDVLRSGPSGPTSPTGPTDGGGTGTGPPPSNLTGTWHNDSGSIALQVSWGPPAGGGAVTGYEVTRSAGGYRATSTVPTTSFRDDDERSYCRPSVRYDVRALFRGADGKAVAGQAATTTVRSQTNCTPDVVIGALNGGAGRATVTLLCTGGRGGNNHGTLAVLVDGAQKWSTECRITSAGGEEYQTTVTGLSPGSHQVTATSTSLSGTTSTPAQAVTVS